MLNIQIFNLETVEKVDPTFNISSEEIVKAYSSIFKEYPLENINLIFVNNEYIQNLNKEYRDIDAPTDVLSFNIDDKSGEIYISPEYVYNSYKEDAFEEEIVRLIIHGTLHILGHDHEDSLNDNPDEEMFVLQEDLVKRFISKCS